MESKEVFVRHLKNIRRKEFYSRLSKVLFLAFFIILIPFILYSKAKESDILTMIVLLIAEFIFIAINFNLIKEALEFRVIKNSRIYQSIENPETVSEIIVSPFKIIFELKEMEDETLFIKHSVFRTKIIMSIKEVFGETKIVHIINP